MKTILFSFLLLLLGSPLLAQTAPPSDSLAVPEWQDYDFRYYEPFRCPCTPMPRDTTQFISPYEYLLPSQATMWKENRQLFPLQQQHPNDERKDCRAEQPCLRATCCSPAPCSRPTCSSLLVILARTEAEASSPA
jgi:hypothetical protein